MIGSDANYQSIVNSLTEILWQQVEEQLRTELSVSVTDYLNAQLEVRKKDYLIKIVREIRVNLKGFQPSGDRRK